MIVEVLGPDGVGKTTFAKALAAALTEEGETVLRYHYRTKVALTLDGSGKASFHKLAKRSPRLTVALKGLALWRTSLHRKRTIQIRERFFTDLHVSPHRYCVHAEDVNVAMVFSKFLQKRQVRILLLDDPERIHRRKPELTVSELGHLFEKFESRLGTGYQFDIQVPFSDDPDIRLRQVAAITKFIRTLGVANTVPHVRRAIFVANGPSLREISRRALVSSSKGRAWWLLANLAGKTRLGGRQPRGPADSMVTFYKSHGSRRIVILHSPLHGGTTDVDSLAEVVQIICGSNKEAERERQVLDLLDSLDLPFKTLYQGSVAHNSQNEALRRFQKKSVPVIPFDLPNSLIFGYARRTRDATAQEIIGALSAFRSILPGHILIHRDFTFWNFFGSSNGAVLLDCGEAVFLKVDKALGHEQFYDMFSYFGSLGVKSHGRRRFQSLRTTCELVWSTVYRVEQGDSCSTLETAASVMESKFREDGRMDLSEGLRRLFENSTRMT